MKDTETVSAIIVDMKVPGMEEMQKEILCGYCGHKAGEIINGVIYLKCKHKDAGRVCKKINRVDLQGKIEPSKSVI
jgi:hypothetical protein